MTKDLAVRLTLILNICSLFTGNLMGYMYSSKSERGIDCAGEGGSECSNSRSLREQPFFHGHLVLFLIKISNLTADLSRFGRLT